LYTLYRFAIFIAREFYGFIYSVFTVY